jgi:acyl-CoA reductase-like NAD-dependent aldehyde dehydrogenase
MTTYELINPYDSSLLATLSYTSKEEMFKALETVHRGKEDIKHLSPYERSCILTKLADLMLRDKDKLAKQITLEMGKTITDSLTEMDRAITTIKVSAMEALNIHGEVLHSDISSVKKNRRGYVEYFPMGVVLCITPFNFPINLSVHKIGPAFAAGNTILFKPGPQNLLSATMLTNLCYEAGMKESFFKLINPEIAHMSELITHENIQCISFTGGVLAAKSISAKAGIKKLLFELGGNDPLIVMPDGDLELASHTAIQQRFGTAGQRCTACKKLFIHQDVYEEFKKLLITKAKDLKIGDPLKVDTFIGPVVHKKAADEVMSRLDQAVLKGAKVLLGHKREGNIIHPTILENLPMDCDLIREETFGPVLPLMRFSDLNQVISLINQSDFGLQAGIFTNDLNVTKKVYQELQVGALIVNDGPGFRVEHFPFGGVKNSGLGREGVRYAIREMSVMKTLVL